MPLLIDCADLCFGEVRLIFVYHFSATDINYFCSYQTGSRTGDLRFPVFPSMFDLNFHQLNNHNIQMRKKHLRPSILWFYQEAALRITSYTNRTIGTD